MGIKAADAARSPFELDAAARLQLLDSLGFGVWAYDGEDIRYVNHALTEITGYSVDELLRPNAFQSLVHPDHVDMILERGKARVRGETVPDRYEIAIIAKDGRERWLELHAQRIDLPDGRPVSLVSCVEITRLKRSEVRIREGTERVLAVLNSIPATVIVTDPAGKPVLINAHWLTLTGMSMERALADGTSTVIHPEDVPRAHRDWTEAKRTVTGYDIDYRVLDHNGDYRWQSFRIRPVKDPDGKLAGWTSAAIDVHEAKMLSLRLTETNRELERANTIKDEILSLVSHELRTPMTTLLGHTNLLKRRFGQLPEADRDELLRDMEHDARRLFAIIENMLALSRSDGTADAYIEPVLVERVVAQAVSEAQERLRERPITVSVEGTMQPASANGTYVRQIVTNLLSNADKYSPGGAPILVKVANIPGGVELSVADRGHGIEAADLPRIFDPFYRSADSAERAYGMGLGLTVCQRLVEHMGGTITAHNRNGGGAEFRVRLPLCTTEG